MPTGGRRGRAAPLGPTADPAELELVGTGLVTVAYESESFRALAAADGVALIVVAGPGAGRLMLVERLYVATTTPTGTTMRGYVGNVADANRASWTPDGNEDEAEFDPPLMVPGTSPLTLRWEAMNAGDEASARVQYRVAEIR